MKNRIFSLLFALPVIIFTMISCASSQSYGDPQKTQELLASGQFSFNARRASPTNMDVINVMNSMPYNNSARMLNLDAGYTVDFTKEKITANLPYFGRMFTASMDPTKNGFNFSSTDFTIDTSKSNSEKTVWTVTLKDQQNIRQMFLEIYKNGKAYLSVNANDRQAISYDGYISAPENAKSGK